MGRFFAASIMALAAGAVHAQEFRGAEVSAEILGYTDDLDIGETNYRGSLEFGIFGGFGIQADLAFHDSRSLDFGSQNLTLHASYDLSSFGTVGAFYSRDDLEAGDLDDEADVYGVEAGRSFGAAGAEGFLAQLDADGEDAVLAGFEGAYDVTDGISIIAEGGTLRSDASSLGRLAVGAEYRLASGPALYAQVGRLGVEVDGAEGDGATFVTLGARIGLGPQGGTTFGSRGLFDVVTGF